MYYKRIAIALASFIALMFIFKTLEKKQEEKVFECVAVEVNNKYMHFSLDDVQECTSNLSTGRHSTIFQDSTFNILKEWHNKYGIVVSLFVQGDFNINHKYAQELIDNSYWLKFGYHGTTASRNKSDMHKFYRQVMDSVGSSVIIDQCPRIHGFHADHKTCMELKQFGCVGFLTCDDWSWNSKKRESNYYLSKGQNWTLDKCNRLLDTLNNVHFIKTDFRLEHIDQRWRTVNKLIEYYSNGNIERKELIVFSHEWNFRDYIPQADSIFSWAKNEGFEFAFPMNK